MNATDAKLLLKRIGHEFNNLLNIIRMHTDTDLNRLSKEELAGKLRIAGRMSRRGIEIIRNLFDILRADDIRPARIHPEPVLDPVIHLVRNTCRENIDLSYASELGADVTVMGDAEALKQAVFNLCLNAISAMPAGGRIRIYLSTCRGSEIASEFPEAGNDEEFVQIKVGDTGEGITETDLDRIFIPYYTTKRKEGGIGIGLTLVKAIVSRHNGYISVVSRRGVGTTFFIHLPVCSSKDGVNV